MSETNPPDDGLIRLIRLGDTVRMFMPGLEPELYTTYITKLATDHVCVLSYLGERSGPIKITELSWNDYEGWWDFTL